MNFKVNLKKEIDNSYPIEIDYGILNFAKDHISKNTKATKFLIVTNNTVEALYGKHLKEQLSGLEVHTVCLPDGEEYKDINSLQTLWDKATELKLERTDCIIALGGGIIGDIAGFAAATYLRGIDFIQIPTTLLAQVDSSVGGKVAINHKEGKNLLGNFYQPKLVLIDTATLKSLPKRELQTGLAEVLKYAFIEKSCASKEDFELANFLKHNREKIYALEKETMIQLISICCRLKASVVSRDETEQGLRAILNLGHTIGHAIEKATNYKTFKHGEAVAMGIIGAFKIAYEKSLIQKNHLDEAITLLKKYELSYRIPQDVPTESVLKAITYDKKIKSGKIRFVLPKSTNTVTIVDDVSEEQMLMAIEFTRNPD